MEVSNTRNLASVLNTAVELLNLIICQQFGIWLCISICAVLVVGGAKSVAIVAVCGEEFLNTELGYAPSVVRYDTQTTTPTKLNPSSNFND